MLFSCLMVVTRTGEEGLSVATGSKRGVLVKVRPHEDRDCVVALCRHFSLWLGDLVVELSPLPSLCLFDLVGLSVCLRSNRVSPRWTISCGWC